MVEVEKKTILWYYFTMDSQKTEVLTLLEQNIFLPEEKRTLIEVKIGTLSSEKLTALRLVLERGLQKQTQVLVEAHKKNPLLFSKIQNLIRGQKQVAITDKEKVDRREEQVELSELEKQVDTLFK